MLNLGRIKKMLRPFKNFAEFKKVTGCDIGTAITTHFKWGCDKVTRLIVSFNDDIYTIGLGTTLYNYKEILDNFTFLNKKTGMFEPLGVEEKEEQEEPENVKPAKFKVGHIYTDIDNDEYTILAKYRNPKNKRLYIVVSDESDEPAICEVIQDLNGSEFAFFDEEFEHYQFYAKDLISD